MKLPTSPAARAAGIEKNHENAVTVSAELDAPETLTGLGRVSIGASFNLGVFTTIRFAADRVIRRSSFGDYPVALNSAAVRIGSWSKQFGRQMAGCCGRDHCLVLTLLTNHELGDPHRGGTRRAPL
jgi:hypothetical protein